MPQNRNRRKIKNLVQKPSLQYKHAVYYFAFMVVGAILVQVVMLGTLQRFMIETLLASGVDPLRVQQALNTQLRGYMLRITMLFPVLGLGAMFLALRMTHRFLGPQVPMRRHVRALIDGDYSSRCHIRKGDELQELATDLNALAETLAERSEQQPEQVAA